jgi:hypothetical protein
MPVEGGGGLLDQAPRAGEVPQHDVGVAGARDDPVREWDR